MPDHQHTTHLGRIIGELALQHGLIETSDLEKAIKACSHLDNGDELIPEFLVRQGHISQKNHLTLTTIAKTKLARQQDLIFGQLAIKKEFITPHILKLALDEQAALFKSEKRYTLLGDILVDAGMLTLQQRDTLLAAQGRLNTDPQQENRNETEALINTKRISHGAEEAQSEITSPSAPSDIGDMPPPKKRFASSEVLPSGIKLIIQEDGNAAFLMKTDAFTPTLSIGELKELLASRNILYGIVDNTEIQHFIDTNTYHEKAFKIAQGNAPTVSQGTSVTYLFPRHKLTAGTIREDGTIDFRERGGIPQVKQGDVLAVKKNIVQGKAGKNIFNDLIRPPEDIRLKAGKGAYLSEDRLQVIAAVSGHPKISRDGVIFVYQSYVIQGDVDFETGNIDYQGDVIIKGCVQNGFKVKANNIKAESTDGAILMAEGDVTITQGITESTISARGSLSARFIQTSKISCLGDFKTDKEVVDAHLECSGRAVINGVVIHSTISAKMGVYANQIGMEKAAPSIIRVGIDTFAKKEADSIENEIEQLKKDEKTLIADIADIQEAISTMENKISRISETKNDHDEERLMLFSILSEETGRKRANQKKIDQIRHEMNRLIKSVDEINLTLAQCRETIRENEESLSEKEVQLHRGKERLRHLMDERQTLFHWMEENPGFAMVKVEKKLMARTQIIGCHTEKTISSSVSKVVVREDQESRSRENNSGVWKMYISRV